MTSIDPYQDGATVTLKRGVGGKTLETILIVDLWKYSYLNIKEVGSALKAKKAWVQILAPDVQVHGLAISYGIILGPKKALVEWTKLTYLF